MKSARDLRPIPLTEILPLGSKPWVVMTMSEGQWDATLSAAYAAGFVLLELDDDEKPVRAYRKAEE
jgi:hypothetical protein